MELERFDTSVSHFVKTSKHTTTMRNTAVFGLSAHHALTETVCNMLGIPPASIFLSKFSVGETRVEIQESVRGKDIYIIQGGSGRVNDNLMELLITISACKTASAKKVTVVLPLFPYSRQSDLPYNKVGAPLAKAPLRINKGGYTFDSRPQTPGADQPNGSSSQSRSDQNTPKRSDTEKSTNSDVSNTKVNGEQDETHTSPLQTNTSVQHHRTPTLEPQRGYRQWVAQAGTLVADLLTCAGTDHVITMDLHDPQYQGFFDIPVDNLYGRHLLRRFIERQIPNYQEAVIVSPDAGGAKRATAIADALGMPFALIHKERRPNTSPANLSQTRDHPSMILVGTVIERTAILVDDLIDTANTITRAAKLLKKEGAEKIYALVTHGVLSGDAIDRINHSALDKLVVTNSVDQTEHLQRCNKLEVLEVGEVFAEVSLFSLMLNLRSL